MSHTDGNTELVVQDKRSASIAQVQDTLPQDPIMALMSKFASNDAISPEKAKMLLDIYVDGQRRMQEMQDERAFAEAMADFKKNPPKIVRNRTAKVSGTAKGSGREYNYEYSYADLNQYCEQTMPLLAERGITWSFPFSEDKGVITVSCVLRYGLYNHTPTTLSGSPEGGNNPMQAKGVTVAYLERYTFAGATGLTAAMPDKDGNSSKPTAQQETMADETIDEWCDAMRQAPDINQLKPVFSQCYNAAKKLGDESAKKRFVAVYEQEKRNLGGAQ